MRYLDLEAKLKSGEMTIGDLRELGLFLVTAMQGVLNYPERAWLPTVEKSMSSTVFIDERSWLKLVVDADDRLTQLQMSEMTTDLAKFQHRLRTLFINFLTSSSPAIDQQQPFGQLGIHLNEPNRHGGTMSRTLEMDNLNDPEVIWFYQVLAYLSRDLLEQ